MSFTIEDLAKLTKCLPKHKTVTFDSQKKAIIVKEFLPLDFDKWGDKHAHIIHGLYKCGGAWEIYADECKLPRTFNVYNFKEDELDGVFKEACAQAIQFARQEKKRDS